MEWSFQKQLKSDFTTYMLSFYQEYQRFSIEDFGEFATTLLSIYVNNRIIEVSEKKEAAYFLASIYNQGMGGRITEEH